MNIIAQVLEREINEVPTSSNYLNFLKLIWIGFSMDLKQISKNSREFNQHLNQTSKLLDTVDVINIGILYPYVLPSCLFWLLLLPFFS